MIILLSPSKTLDFQNPAAVDDFTQPDFIDESEKLIKTLRNKSQKALRDLMSISKDLAKLNSERYNSWSRPFAPDNAKQSIYAFRGDVYDGLKVDEYNEEDVAFAQDHVRILSGLYGLLRPLDLIQPYRLEMGTKLKTRRGKNLYEFWGKSLTKTLNQELAESENPVVINLASNEYFSALQREKIKSPVIDIYFKELRDGEYKNITLFMKQARGLLTSYIVQNRITEPDKIKDFDWERYSFNQELSNEKEYYFTRPGA